MKNSFKIINIGINSPDISIAMLAYNHERFIAEAIESVLMQKTSYTYKIIIAEDFSTDNTRKIVLEYQKKYPDKIKLILQEQNVGAGQNNIDLLSNLEGKYIAALEGDDYWTDPLKLQKQVDFLEENEEYGVVWSKFNKVDFRGCLVEENIPHFEESLLDVTVDNFFEYYRTWTLTCIFKAAVITKYGLLQFKHLKDNTIFFAALHNSKGRVLDFNSACYRVHKDGIWSSNSELENLLSNFFNFNEIRKKIVSHKSIDVFLESNLKDIVRKIRVSEYFEISVYNKIFFPVLINLEWKWKLIFLKTYFIRISSFFLIKANNDN